MKRIFLCALAALTVSFSAHAQFGGLLGGARGGGGGDTGALIDRFNADSALINRAVAHALAQIVVALGTKEQAASVQKVYEESTKKTDAKEVGALQGTIIKTNGAIAQEALSAKDAKEKIEKLSPEIQKKVAESIFAVGVASFKIPGLLDNGKKIIEGIGSNPMMIARLPAIKDGLSLLADAAPKLAPLVSTGLSLMREVKVDPGNPSASAELKAPPPGLAVPESN